MGLKSLSHEDLSNHYCVDWLKAHEAHFSRAKILETADSTGILKMSIIVTVNYMPLKEMGSPDLIVEPPKHRNSIARIRVAITAQLRAVQKLLEPKSMGLPGTAYTVPNLTEDAKYRRSNGNSQLVKTLAVYDRSDPGAVRAIIVAGSDFEGTSPKLFWPETLVYLLPSAELNQMLTLFVAIMSETPCEPELLLFAGMNDHLHAAGLLEHLRSGEPSPKKIWESIQTLFAAMNEVQELVASRLGSETKVVFASSPGYAGMPPALQFAYAMLILIAEGNGWRVRLAAPNCELELVNLRLLKSEVAAAWVDVSHALRGFLIVLDEVLCLGGVEFCPAVEIQPGGRGRLSRDYSFDSQLVVSEHGTDDNELYQQCERTEQ